MTTNTTNPELDKQSVKFDFMGACMEIKIKTNEYEKDSFVDYLEINTYQNCDTAFVNSLTINCATPEDLYNMALAFNKLAVIFENKIKERNETV